MAAAAYTYAFDPNSTGVYPICPLRALTNLDCPLCGALRATHSLLHGDVVAAADYNAFFVLLLPVALVIAALWALRTTFRLPIPKLEVPPRVTTIGLVVIVVFGVVRNLPIPGYAFLNSTVMIS